MKNSFMQPNPEQPRPDHFQSIALRGAISEIARCRGIPSHPDVLGGKDFQTAMFDEVKSHVFPPKTGDKLQVDDTLAAAFAENIEHAAQQPVPPSAAGGTK
jgi:hypothetical protein